MHKRPEDGMWLPTGGQIDKMVAYVYNPPRHREIAKERKIKNDAKPSNSDTTFNIKEA